MTNTFQSPLSTRAASREMCEIWGNDRKYKTWRKLWAALAQAQSHYLDTITREQVSALWDHIDDPIDYDKVEEYENRFKHDVMAHLHAFGDIVPESRGVLHLGATSQYVCDNTDLILMKDAMALVRRKLAAVITRLAKFAINYKTMPALAYTHFQPAQPLTIGRRAIGWAYDLILVLDNIEHVCDNYIKFRGVRGTTGTFASLKIIHGGIDIIEDINRKICSYIEWDAGKTTSGTLYRVTSQTYPRVVDTFVASSLGSLAAVSQKIASDIRLLSGRSEIREDFESTQVGSSAMPYKRNPIKCEKICSLARLIIGLQSTTMTTAAEQWLERTLDDSMIRRINIPEMFLAADGILDLLEHVISNLYVDIETINKNLDDNIYHIMTEHLLMQAVSLGYDRQDAHERIRKCILGGGNVEENLRKDEVLGSLDFDSAVDPQNLVGYSAEQVDYVIDLQIRPIAAKYGLNF